MRTSTVIWAVICSLNASAQAPSTLKLGAAVQRSAPANSQHAFLLGAMEPSVVRVRVVEMGADVLLRVRDQYGKLLCEADGRGGGWETDMLICELPSRGRYRLSATVQSVTASAPRFTVEWTETDVGGPLPQTAIQATFANAVRSMKRPKADLKATELALDNAGKLAAAAGDLNWEGEVTFAMGALQGLRNNTSEALATDERAIELFRRAGDLAGEARARNDAGWYRYMAGQHDQADAHQQRALELWTRLNDDRGLAITRAHLARGQYVRRNKDAAIELWQTALSWYRQHGDLIGQSSVLGDLALLYESFGDRATAIESNREALRLVAGRGDPQEGYSRGNLAALYHTVGEYTLAQAEYKKTIQLAVANADRYLESQSRLNYASLLTDMDRPAEALVALANVRETIEAENWAGLAGVWNNTAHALRELGRLRESYEAVQKALEFFLKANEPRGVRITRTNLGKLETQFGRLDAARNHLDRALSECQEANDPDQAALVMSALARVDATEGKFDVALARIDEAIKTAESERSRLLRDDLRSAYLSVIRPLYERKVDILMRMDRVQPERNWRIAAFEASEAARARAITEIVPGARERLRGVPAELLDKEAKARKRLHDALRPVGADVQDLIAELHTIQAQIRTANPRYAEAGEGVPISYSQAAELIDDDTAVVEFLLGEERSFAWVLTAKGANLCELPPSRRFDELSKRVRLAVRQGGPGFIQSARELSRLLFGCGGQLPAGKRLAIVPDRALHAVPFAALPIPGRSRYTPLIAEREIVVLPSLSVLRESRIRAHAYRRPAALNIAVIGDPVYEQSDQRVAPVARKAAASSRFHRLQFSEDEIVAISELSGGKARVFSGFDAAVDRVAGSAMSRFDVLHFATHGVLNEVQPEFSGLALSMIGRDGKPVDGLLRLIDIYALNTPARLVVLSACETGLGRNVIGEGVIGLSRGFLFAGATTVVSSLWSVQDNSTADLMKGFYTSFLRDAAGPAAALRRAQLGMLKSRRWSDPYYWAGFVVNGDWQ